MSPAQFTVFIVDDDESTRHSLTGLLAAEGFNVRAFCDGREFIASEKNEPYGCAIVDVRMPNMDGLTLLEKMLVRDIHYPVIFLSAYGTASTAAEAMKSGAFYFLEKPVEPSVLLTHVHEAVERDAQLSDTMAVRQHAANQLASLTRREREIFELVIGGLTSKEIARRLYRSEKTVQLHRAHILRKLDARGVADLARIAQSAQMEIAAAEPVH